MAASWRFTLPASPCSVFFSAIIVPLQELLASRVPHLERFETFPVLRRQVDRLEELHLDVEIELFDRLPGNGEAVDRSVPYQNQHAMIELKFDWAGEGNTTRCHRYYHLQHLRPACKEIKLLVQEYCTACGTVLRATVCRTDTAMLLHDQSFVHQYCMFKSVRISSTVVLNCCTVQQLQSVVRFSYSSIILCTHEK